MDSPARPANNWAGSIVTRADPKPVEAKIIKKVPVVVPPVSFGNAEVAIDSITVSWTYKDFTNQESTKMLKDKENPTETAKATHFVLERQVGSSGKWEVLGDKFDVKTQQYVDSKIDPKTKYSYRVTAFSTDKNYLARGGKIDPTFGAEANPEGKVNTANGPTITTMGIWNIVFSQAMKGADAAKGMVYIKVEKFEKGIGKVESKHIHYDGDAIGTWAETDGAEPTSKHRVSNKGKQIMVDFNSGATLVSVAPVKLTVEVKRCKPIYDKSTGNKTGCDQTVEKRSFDTHAVTYKDDEGVHKIHVPSPTTLDQQCEEHGGPKKIVTRSPDAPGDKPDEPKMDPKEAAKAKKEAEAEKIFNDAEAALDKNKSLAQSYYNKLLRDYADTDFVSKSKKATIEERLAGLKKK